MSDQSTYDAIIVGSGITGGAGWIAIGTLVITGVINLYYRGWLHWDGVLSARAFWTTGTGYALACKLIAVTAMITVSAIHDLALGPRAGAAARTPCNSVGKPCACATP